MDQEAIKTLMEWATQIKDGVSAELPKLAAEIVAFELWSSVAWLAGCVLAIPVSVAAMVWSSRDERRDTDHPIAFLVFIGSIVVTVLSVVGVGVHSTQAIKAATAPRLVVVEKIKSICK